MTNVEDKMYFLVNLLKLEKHKSIKKFNILSQNFRETLLVTMSESAEVRGAE